MKRLLSIIFSCIFFATISQAQSHDLIIHSEAGKLYLIHKVVAKENWYSVGRIYNISPRDIAPFNGLTLEKSLAIGQELKIPLNNINFSQDGKKNADETFVPVHHIVQPNETLSHVSTAYKSSLENLEKWNKIKKDGAKENMQLIVGYMKVKTALSYLATDGAKNIPQVSSMKGNEDDNGKDEKKNTMPSEKSQALVKQTKLTNSPSPNNEPQKTYTGASSNTHSTGGFFSSDYNEGNNTLSGTAGTFKSTSGWSDGKYYILINNVAVGTIVKVIAPATQKSVYAKVLGQLPDMKESEGLMVRISNSAANELGETEGKFGVQVKY